MHYHVRRLVCPLRRPLRRHGQQVSISYVKKHQRLIDLRNNWTPPFSSRHFRASLLALNSPDLTWRQAFLLVNEGHASCADVLVLTLLRADMPEDSYEHLLGLLVEATKTDAAVGPLAGKEEGGEGGEGEHQIEEV